MCALLCSHLSAFRVATNLRLAVSENLAKLPLGFTESFGSGKLRKVIHESTGAAETYLAHQLPDQCSAMATPVGLLVLLFVFDWRLGLLSLVPVFLGFAIMSAMTGKRMAEKMRQCGNALAAMSNEAVEYVRGIPVVKTFGQSVFSFKKFKGTIDEYEKWVVAYTKELRGPMMLYTAAINGVFTFLIAGGLLFTKDGVSSEFLLNLLFYIIITPVISLTLTKIMYMSESKLIVAGAPHRIDSVLDAEPVPQSAEPEHPKDGSVALKDVHFGYDDETEVMAALRTAQCMDHRKVVHTVIGTKGVYLSGGERQRISIARAFLKDAPIILLDEATASLDVENETLIQTALSRLIKNKTVLIIAHRMRTVAGADKIVVLSDGVVAEQGSPSELYAQNGIYTHMAALQTQGQNWTI